MTRFARQGVAMVVSTSAFSVTGNGVKRFVSVLDCVLDSMREDGGHLLRR